MSHSGVSLLDPYLVFEKIGLAEGMRVADFGCGRTGHFVFSAARIVGEKGIVYAVDVMKDVLESLASRIRSEGYDNVQTIWSDIELPGKTAIPAGSLDGCFIVNVFFLLTKKAEAFKEAARLIKPGGWFAITEWSQQLGPLGPPKERMVTPDTLLEFAASFGFSLLEQFPMGNYHYCLLLKKDL